MSEQCVFHLEVWRQDGPNEQGQFQRYDVRIDQHASFLEMLDQLNEDLIKAGQRPVEFDSDCREGICGSCGCVIDGQAHGPNRITAVCQLHMRFYQNGQTVRIEPWRAKGFPVIRDLVVDRSAFDRIIEAGGYVSVNTGPKPDSNSFKIGKDVSDRAMDAATCIGCGACVAACPNSSASLFTGAKISQFKLLPQGHPERGRRVVAMVDEMDKQGFGPCSNLGECEAACPKGISLDNIAIMKREYLLAALGAI